MLSCFFQGSLIQSDAVWYKMAAWAHRLYETYILVHNFALDWAIDLKFFNYILEDTLLREWPFQGSVH